MGGARYIIIVFCTEMPGNDNTGAHGKTVEKADHQENQIAGGTDSCHGSIAQEITDTPSVKGVIQLLEYLPQKNRQGE